ncbi:MAG: T9SS type A sorting domain-containing protein [Melioribacteraceae bacterium]|nr:T9SS type A sorting domain-containing protein [Melioribacteraceae bacterium]
MKSKLSQEKSFDFVNPQLKYNILRKDKNTKLVQIDSIFIIKLASFDEGETSLDTTKQIFSYSLLGNSYSRTSKSWNGKEWNNYYRTTSTYDFNLRFQKLLIEKWVDNHWAGDLRQTYTYYMDEKSYAYVEESFDGTSWHKDRRITNEYNPFGSETLVQIEEWINGSWVDSYKMVAEYDLNNNKIKDTRESWNKGNLEATLTSTYTFTSFNKTATYYYEVIQYGSRTYGERYFNSFDDVGNIISSEHQKWENNDWNNSVLYTYDYYPDGKVKTYLYQKWARNKWTNNFSKFYVYDERGNEIEITYNVWEENILKNIWRESFTYNSKNQELTSLTESLINDTPQNLYRSEYQYNEYGYETYYISEEWIDKKWIGISRRSSTYDKDGKLVDAIAERWNGGWEPSNHWFSNPGLDGYSRWSLDYYKLSAYYSKREPIDYNNPTKIELYQNYPNPFNSITRIHFSLPNNGFVKLYVYDILGQEITSLINKELSKGTHTVDFNSSNLPSGVYLYRLVTDKYNQTKKMILLK